MLTEASNVDVNFADATVGKAGYAHTAGISTYTSEWILGANGINDYTFTGPGLTGTETDPKSTLVRVSSISLPII